MDTYIWSRYNYMFKSKKYGSLIYNSLSNTFAEFTNEVYDELEEIKKNPSGYDFNKNIGLYLQLIQARILIKPGDEQDIITQMAYNKLKSNYSDTSLGLTIAPTLECNFNCIYCYEDYRQPVHMDDETENELVEFIKRHKNISSLSVTWYGGEPLLKFERIVSLTKKIKELKIPYNAGIITNGYLLTEEIIDKLKDLNINFIQLTIDGPKEIHNKRRPHLKDPDSFTKILENMKMLIKKWDGNCSVRINIDEDNMKYYAETYHILKEYLKDKKHSIYPGIIEKLSANHPDLSCPIDTNKESDFYIKQYHEHGISELEFYPSRSRYITCVANAINGYVIAPKGDIYKCWRDIGNENLKIGSIYKGIPWNMKLLSQYAVGTDAYNDPECLKCFYLPICGGGCPQTRFMIKYHGEKKKSCIKFKWKLNELLEIHYEKQLKKNKNKSE